MGWRNFTLSALLAAVVGITLSASFVQPCPPLSFGVKHRLLSNDTNFKHSTMYKGAIFAESIESDISSLSQSTRLLGPSNFFLILAAMLGRLLLSIQKSSLSLNSVGTASLVCVTFAVLYDNLVIGLGAMHFSFSKLKWLSYPRFYLHFVGVPFLYTTTAEIGKAASVSWLERDSIQRMIVVLAAVIASISTRRFVLSNGIQLADTSEFPPQCMAQQLVWFTYAKQDFLYYVAPSIVLAFWSILVGTSALKLAPVAGAWLIVSGVGVLIGSAQKKHVARFTGNLVEVTMLWCMFKSAVATLAV